MWTCSICNIPFSLQRTHRVHLKKFHGVLPKLTNSLIKCPVCHLTTRNTEKLIVHVATFHNVHPEIRHVIFQNNSEFEKWLKEEEMATKSKFRKSSGTKALICHRSGEFKPKVTNRKRTLKSQGSCKIGGTCTSYMKVSSGEGECLHIKYNATHFGHEPEVSHLLLTKEEKNSIARKLQLGIKIEQILKDAHEYELEGKMRLLKRTDVTNVINEYRLPPELIKELRTKTPKKQKKDDVIVLSSKVPQVDAACPNCPPSGVMVEDKASLRRRRKKCPKDDVIALTSKVVEDLENWQGSREILNAVVLHLQAARKLLQGATSNGSRSG